MGRLTIVDLLRLGHFLRHARDDSAAESNATTAETRWTLVLHKLMIDSKAYKTMAALLLMALSPEQASTPDSERNENDDEAFAMCYLGLATQKDAEIKLMHQPRPTPTDAINLI